MFKLVTYQELKDTNRVKYRVVYSGEELLVELTPEGFQLFVSDTSDFTPPGILMEFSGSYPKDKNVTFTMPLIILFEFVRYIGVCGLYTHEMIENVGVRLEKRPEPCVN